MQIGTVECAGTIDNPVLFVNAPMFSNIPGTLMTYKDWVKSLPGARWHPKPKRWSITSFGPYDPQASVEAVGLQFVDGGGGYSVADLAALAEPVVAPYAGGRTVDVLARLAGDERMEGLLGPGAILDADAGAYRLPVSDVLTWDGYPKPGLAWPQNVLDRAAQERSRVTVAPEYSEFAWSCSTAITLSDEDEMRLRDWLALIPDWFGLDLFGYQKFGAIAAFLGHNFIADEPGVGKTRTGLATAAIHRSKRTVIIAPPLLLSMWKANVEESGLHVLGGNSPDGEAVALIGTSKRVQHPPDSGVFIVADSKLAHRPELVEELKAWQPEVMVYDEAHRAMTMGSMRSEAAQEIAAHSKVAVPMSGTPMPSGPHQLIPSLEMSGHMSPIFGGRTSFISRYCELDYRGKLRATRDVGALEELGATLERHVYVRRRKADVLPFLPKKIRDVLPVSVPLGHYKEAHREINETIDQWIERTAIPALDGFGNSEAKMLELPKLAQEYAADSVQQFSSTLRAAAGRCKVPAAVEFIELHDLAIDEQGLVNRPLIIWAYHRDTIAELVAAATEKFGDQARVAAIYGGVGDATREQIVTDFQAGKIAVLVGGITSASVGLTLTRCQDVLFVESSWVPSDVTQAEDRAHRIGAEHNISILTMIADDTIDGVIQQVLRKKGVVLGAVTGGDVNVAVQLDGEDTRLGELVLSIVEKRLASHPQTKPLFRRKAKAA